MSQYKINEIVDLAGDFPGGFVEVGLPGAPPIRGERLGPISICIAETPLSASLAKADWERQFQEVLARRKAKKVEELDPRGGPMVVTDLASLCAFAGYRRSLARGPVGTRLEVEAAIALAIHRGLRTFVGGCPVVIPIDALWSLDLDAGGLTHEARKIGLDVSHAENSLTLSFWLRAKPASTVVRSADCHPIDSAQRHAIEALLEITRREGIRDGLTAADAERLGAAREVLEQMISGTPQTIAPVPAPLAPVPSKVDIEPSVTVHDGAWLNNPGVFK